MVVKGVSMVQLILVMLCVIAFYGVAPAQTGTPTLMKIAALVLRCGGPESEISFEPGNARALGLLPTGDGVVFKQIGSSRNEILNSGETNPHRYLRVRGFGGEIQIILGVRTDDYNEMFRTSPSGILEKAARAYKNRPGEIPPLSVTQPRFEKEKLYWIRVFTDAPILTSPSCPNGEHV